jgi:hypothetical protein
LDSYSSLVTRGERITTFQVEYKLPCKRRIVFIVTRIVAALFSGSAVLAFHLF